MCVLLYCQSKMALLGQGNALVPRAEVQGHLQVTLASFKSCGWRWRADDGVRNSPMVYMLMTTMLHGTCLKLMDAACILMGRVWDESKEKPGGRAQTHECMGQHGLGKLHS